jgi:hypothetical protein
MQRFEHVHNEQERQLLEMIDFLQKEYAKAAKPYVDRLIAIRQRTITPQMIVTLEQARGLSISPESTP